MVASTCTLLPRPMSSASKPPYTGGGAAGWDECVIVFRNAVAPRSWTRSQNGGRPALETKPSGSRSRRSIHATPAAWYGCSCVLSAGASVAASNGCRPSVSLSVSRSASSSSCERLAAAIVRVATTLDAAPAPAAAPEPGSKRAPKRASRLSTAAATSGRPKTCSRMGTVNSVACGRGTLPSMRGRRCVRSSISGASAAASCRLMWPTCRPARLSTRTAFASYALRGSRKRFTYSPA